ncbi:MAG: NAD(P)/FAD-dependent oxidoreductase [Nakamurella sp.]
MADSCPGGRGRPHVVVVGGGFGGLAAVHGLRDADVDVTLIDRHTYNTFQPLLYQVATATLNPGDITWFLRSIRAHQDNVRFLKGTVVSMDHAARTVVLDGGQSIGYDYLIIAAGVTANFFGVPGAPENSMPLYRRSQALALRDRMFAALEEAVVNGQDRDLRIVVVGGGATGVETAGALAELRNNDLPVTYPELTPTRVHITLVEQLPFLLAPFHPRLREYARRSLEKRGVDLRLATTVKQVRPDGVILDDQVLLHADIVVWASGVTVHEQVGQWNLPQGRGGRIIVDDHLRVGGLSGVFAVGDVAVEGGDRALPQLAQPAKQGGMYVAALLRATLTGREIKSFEYHDKGTLATIGRNSAIAQVKGLPRLTGFVAWVIWIVVHVFSLLGNRNRFATMLNLTARYLFWHRSHNAIVGETPIIILDLPSEALGRGRSRPPGHQPEGDG